MSNETQQPYEIQKLMDSAISIKDLGRLVRQMYNANQNLFVWGYMGIGKTQEILKFVAEKRKENPKFGYIYLPLASMLAEDLTGSPMPVKDENGITRTIYAIPKIFPTDPDSEGIIVADEYNNALPTVQNATQQFFQERRIGDYELPKGWRIIAMGNQTGVNAYSNEIQAPVKDRFAHIYLEPNSDIWVDYILGLETEPKKESPFIDGITPSQIRELVAGFIKAHPDKLFDKQEYENNSYTFATPRSWERFIKLYSVNLDATKTDMVRFATMYLGSDIANLLREYFENSTKYQNADEILIDGKDFRDNQDMNGYMGTLVSCIAKLVKADDSEKKSQLDNLFKAGLKLKSTDNQVILVKMLLNKTALKPYIDKKYFVEIANKSRLALDELS